MNRVLIGNRGEIAVRIIRSCRGLGLETVAVHSTPDTRAMHVAMADSSVALVGEHTRDTYGDGEKILAAAKEAGADAIHPGYGFLSENAGFARAVTEAGLTWVGAPPDAIEAMGDKATARSVAANAGVGGVPGSDGTIESAAAVQAFAQQFGWPVVIKAAAGGGGRGMRVVRDSETVTTSFEAAQREALASFGDGRVYVERYLDWPRHVEVQLLADAHGNVVTVGDRDCSVQRRHQKLIEEAPAPKLATAVRDGLHAAAAAIARAVDYRGAGTVEFLVENEAFFFLEMNTRLQVEHPVSEAVFGVDLVSEQLRIATGAPISPDLDSAMRRGHAIECRINAEDPAGGRFLPSPGSIRRLSAPSGFGLRFDVGYRAGDEVSQFYDNLVGKLIVWGPNRAAAIRAMRAALNELVIDGIATTIPAHRIVLSHPDFVNVRHATSWLEREVELPDEPQHLKPLGTNDPPEHAVWVNDRRYILEPPLETAGKPPRRPTTSRLNSGRGRTPLKRSAPTGDGTILAPLQGIVVKVPVTAGTEVARGDLLCVLEAMKMENELLALHDGVVSEIRVAPGQSVTAGETLVIVKKRE